MTRRGALTAALAGAAGSAVGIGQPELEPVMLAAGTVATGPAPGPLDHVKGLTVRAYGNSYPNWPARWSYVHRLVDDLHWDLTQASVGGDLAMDTAAWVIGSSSATRWTPGAAHLIVVDAALNDALSYGLDGLNGYRNAMRAILGYLCCEGPMDSESLTYSAGWSIEASGDRHQGSARNGGPTVTAPGFGRAGRWVFGHAGIPRELGLGATFDIKADGVKVGVLNSNDACRASARTQLGSTAPRTRGANATVVNLAAGATSFTLARTNTGGGPWVDWYGKIDESGSAPLVVLPVPLYLPDYSGTAGSDSVIDAYAAALAGVAAEVGPTCVVVDARPGWDRATMILPGDIHPTARGHAHIAAAVTAALAGVEWWPS